MCTIQIQLVHCAQHKHTHSQNIFTHHKHRTAFTVCTTKHLYSQYVVHNTNTVCTVCKEKKIISSILPAHSSQYINILGEYQSLISSSFSYSFQSEAEFYFLFKPNQFSLFFHVIHFVFLSPFNCQTKKNSFFLLILPHKTW